MTQRLDGVDSSAVPLLIVQLRFQRGLMVTLGLEPGLAVWLRSGCRKLHGGVSCAETDMEVVP